MEILKWGWLALGLIFLVAEIFTSGFVLACFGVGALAACGMAFLDFGLGWQLAVFVVVSTAAVLASRRFAERVTGMQAEGVGVDRVIGKHGRVIERIDPGEAAGRVRVDVEEWRAESVTGEAIEVGTQVEILGVEGTRLRVRPLETAPAGGES